MRANIMGKYFCQGVVLVVGFCIITHSRNEALEARTLDFKGGEWASFLSDRSSACVDMVVQCCRLAKVSRL